MRTRTSCRLLLAAMLGLSSTISNAAEVTPVRLVDFKEFMQEEVKSSTSLVAGVMRLPARSDLTTLQPVLVLPATPGEKRPASVCVRTRSRDGRYYAHGAVPANASGAVRLQADSGYSGQLRDLDVLDLAVAAVVGDCGVHVEESPVFYVVDRTKTYPGYGDGIRLVFNTERRRTVVEYPGADGKTRSVNCLAIKKAAGPNTAFDTYCDVTGQQRGSLNIQIVRYQQGRPMDPVAIRVLQDP